MTHPDLRTSRLSLRALGRSDRDFILKHFSDPGVNEFLFDAEPLGSLKEADELIDFYLAGAASHNHRYIMRDENGVSVGTLGFHCYDPTRRSIEIGYDLEPAYFKRGYATEAVGAVLAYLRDALPLDKIEACIYPANEASIAVVKKFGFVEDRSVTLSFRGADYVHAVYASSSPSGGRGGRDRPSP